jgi:hypothetical protein
MTATSKERLILFESAMIRAIQAGQKRWWSFAK